VSINCIQCVKNDRTGNDLLCDSCRLFDALDTLYGCVQVYAESPARFIATQEQIRQAIGSAYVALAKARPEWKKGRASNP
jgi:hypothetical protein